MAKPWEKLGVSRRKYFYDKSANKSANCTGVQSSATKTKVVFDGTNGNLCEDITRKEMEAVLERNPRAFVPNWYANGLKSRLETLI